MKLLKKKKFKTYYRANKAKYEEIEQGWVPDPGDAGISILLNQHFKMFNEPALKKMNYDSYAMGSEGKIRYYGKTNGQEKKFYPEITRTNIQSE